MGVGLEIGTSDVLGNEASENRSGRLSKDRRYSQCRWRHRVNMCRSFLTPDRWSKKLGNIGNWNNFDKYVGHANFSRLTYSNN